MELLYLAVSFGFASVLGFLNSRPFATQQKYQIVTILIAVVSTTPANIFVARTIKDEAYAWWIIFTALNLSLYAWMYFTEWCINRITRARAREVNIGGGE